MATGYFWRKNLLGMHESSEKALRIIQITTVIVVILIEKQLHSQQAGEVLMDIDAEVKQHPAETLPGGAFRQVSWARESGARATAGGGPRSEPGHIGAGDVHRSLRSREKIKPIRLKSFP